MTQKKEIIIFGKHPFFTALLAKKRKVFSLFISLKNKNEFFDKIEKDNIEVDTKIINFVTNEKLDSILPFTEKNHQGYIMLASEKKSLQFYDFLENNKNNKNLPKLLILDQILDPHNLGAIIRTSVAFGIKYIIVTSMNSVKDTPVVIKTSAGLTEFVDIMEVQNLNNAIKDLKEIGYFIIGLDGNTKNTIDKITDSSNLTLVLGNEGKGIRELVKKNCDELVKIPMSEEAESLNVSVASAIAIYELWGKL